MASAHDIQDLADSGEFTAIDNIMDFDYFVDMFKELNGNETELIGLKFNFDMNWNSTCDEIIHSITNLPGGAERYFTDVLIYGWYDNHFSQLVSRMYKNIY